jgi:hypothetical protein
MSKLRTLDRRFDKARGQYDTAIQNVVKEISLISGVEDLHCDELAGDGLGISIGDSTVHVGVSELIEIFERTGKITLQDLEQTSL